MALEWSSTSAANASQGVKMLVYGDSGTGKTCLCATAPKPVILSAESGLLSLSKKNLERLYGVGNPHVTYDVPVIQVRNVHHLTEALVWLASPQARQHVSTICIDSLSEIGEVVLSNAKAQVKDPRMAYGELIEKMENTIRQYRDMQGYHVLMTAKMEIIKDEAMGSMKYWPSMPGSKMGPKLPYYFDEVFRLGVNKTPQGVKYRYLQTDSDLQYIAKDRSGVLDEMEQPDATHIINKILGA